VAAVAVVTTLSIPTALPILVVANFCPTLVFANFVPSFVPVSHLPAFCATLPTTNVPAAESPPAKVAWSMFPPSPNTASEVCPIADAAAVLRPTQGTKTAVATSPTTFAPLLTPWSF
jgi:hypothetical protein